MKKIILFLFAIVAGMTYASAGIYSGTHEGNITWEVNASTGVLTISGVGAMASESNNDYYPWYDYKDSIQHVIIEEGVTTIGKRAFYDYYDIISVSLPSTLDSILKSAFEYTHLTLVTLPSNLHYLDESVFANCRYLTSINIPSTLTMISQMTFDRCEKLNNIVLPESVVDIDDCAFRWCSALNNISLGNNIKHIGTDAFLGTAYLKLTEADNLIIYFGPYCVGVAKAGVWSNVSIREGTTLIAEKVFYDQEHMINLTLPNSLMYINDYAFDYCENLRSITFGNSLLEIGYEAFYNNESLTNLQFPNSLQIIGQQAFMYCDSLRSVSFGNSLKIIEDHAFSQCDLLTEIVIPDSVTKIGIGAFYCDSIKRVTIGTSLVEMEDNAFEWKNIRSLTWNAKRCKTVGGSDPDSFTSHPDHSHMKHDNLDSLVFGNEVEYIPAGICYMAVKLDSIAIPQTVTAIGSSAFEDCSLLTKVVIPDKVTLIEQHAFEGCSALETFTCLNPVPPTLGYQGSSKFVNTILRIPCQSFTAYKQSNWNNFFTNYEASSHYQLLVSSADESMGTTTVGNINCDNGTVQIKATPKTGFAFVSWSDGNTTATRSLKLTQDTSLVASFKIKTYTISGAAVNGTVEGTGEYDYGSSVELTAVPNEGYSFDQWSDGITDNPRTVTVLGNAKYTALFIEYSPGAGLDELYSSRPVQKILQDGHIFILRGDKIYTIQGQLVK